jgi:hypothetical protein
MTEIVKTKIVRALRESYESTLWRLASDVVMELTDEEIARLMAKVDDVAAHLFATIEGRHENGDRRSA